MVSLISWLIAFVVAITIHEAAHAWTADRLGDPTARSQGRLSLNPVVHYDRVGTTLLLMLSVMRALGSPVPVFGWAKPVPFDPYNLKDPKRDAMLISLAGPLSNVILATLLALIGTLFLSNPEAMTLAIYSPSFLSMAFASGGITVVSYFFGSVLGVSIYLNLILAVFNLLPIHPLDGGKILIGLLPKSEAHEADMFLRKYGFMLLFLLIIPVGGESAASRIISPLLSFGLSILLPSVGTI